MDRENRLDAVVIGAGIVGAMAAFYLQKDGRRVTLIEREEPAAGASAGNAGILAFPEIIPIAAPGVIWKAPKWLLDPLGPLSIRPSYAPKLIPWLYQFWRASSPERFRRTIEAMGPLMQLARTEMAAVTAEETLSGFVSHTGTLNLYDSAETLDAAWHDWEAKAKAGFQFNRIGRAEIEELQPGLAPQIRHAVHAEGGLQINEPRDFTRAVVDLVISRGATISRLTATRIEPMEDGARLILKNGTVLSARTVVIACGAWSKPLAASLGDSVPLDTERGYNTTLPAGAFDLKRQLYFDDHAFVVTPLSHGVRVGGAVELAGLDLPANFSRSDVLLKKAKTFLPGLKTEGGKQWMGFRPSLADCLPVISRSTRSPAVIYAFGHGHLGLTQSAATGRIVGDLAAGRQAAVKIEPFAVGRFR